MSKFIYALGDEMRDILLAESYKLLKHDAKNNIYIFENRPCANIRLDKSKCVFSDVLIF